MQKIKNYFPFSNFLFLGILCSFPIFLLGYNHVLNLYYEYGCPLEDQAICAYLMWHNQLYVQLPPSIGALWGDAYFPAHFSPILSATSLLSKVINVTMIDFFAYFNGISHALLAFTMFYSLCRLYKLSSISELTIAFFLSIIFSFNGISVASLYYPHYEMLFVPMAILFFAILIQKKPLLALPFFILALSIRECSGFHLFSILFFLILTDILKKRSIYRPYLLYAALAITYGILAVIIQKYLRGNGLCNLTDMYVGMPPYAHLSWELIKERTLFILTNRGYFYAPILIILIWSLLSKRIYLTFGILALLPWFIFNFLALATWPAGLYFYYGIFYLLIFFWPLLAIKSVYGENITKEIKHEVLKWYTVIILSSVLFNNPLNFKNFLLQPGVSQQHIFQRLQTSLHYNLGELGKVLVDSEVTSLAPGIFAKSQVSYLRNTPPEERKKFYGVLDTKIQELETVDSVMFYYFGDGLIPFYILLSHLPNLYKVVGTNVYLASNKTLAQLPSFSPILVPAGYEQEKVLKQQYISSIFKDAYYKKDIKRVQNNFEVQQQSLPGVVVYSNPTRLPKGHYCVQFGLNAKAPIDPKKPILTVDIVSQDTIFIKKDIFYYDLGSSAEKEIKICFHITQNLPHALFSIRFWHDQNTSIVIKDPKID